MKPVPTAIAQPWQPGTLRNAPLLSFTLLGASFLFSGLALFIVHWADDSPVEGWPLSPSVYLSVLATLTGISLRSAFQEVTETYWWSLLLSDSGVRLRTLHHVWELKHGALSRFKISKSDPEPVLRVAGIFLLLMAANGPLLQRAVVVNLISRSVTSTIEVPVRREPMWNLTAKDVVGLSTVVTVYQDELANVVAGLNEKRPLRLSRPACPTNATCTANVTVAGFSKACERGFISIDTEEIPIIPHFRTFGPAHNSRCEVVGGEIAGICRLYTVDFQLGVQVLGHKTISPGELPWPAPDLHPTVLNYTNFFREDSGRDVLTVQRCNFTSAYVNLPIEITEGDIVRMEQLTGPELSRRDRGIESIPSPTDGEYPGRPKILAGIEQTMQDLYGGFSVYDQIEYVNAMQGTGTRQFVNRTDIRPISRLRETPSRPVGFNFSFLDPLESFTETLHELSLRYALETIGSTPERLEEMSIYFPDDESDTSGRLDKRARALEAMTTKPSQSQHVMMQQSSRVAIYQTNILFAYIAVGSSTILSVLVALLLTDWRRCGRPFSMSPLEIAKAFDALSCVRLEATLLPAKSPRTMMGPRSDMAN